MGKYDFTRKKKTEGTIVPSVSVDMKDPMYHQDLSLFRTDLQLSNLGHCSMPQECHNILTLSCF